MGERWVQRQHPTSGGTVGSTRHTNCCQHILPYRLLDGFPDQSQFAAAKLTHQCRNDPRTPRDQGTPPTLSRCMVCAPNGLQNAAQYRRIKDWACTTTACNWWNLPDEDLSSGKLESTHPSRTDVMSIKVFLWRRVSRTRQR